MTYGAVTGMWCGLSGWVGGIKGPLRRMFARLKFGFSSSSGVMYSPNVTVLSIDDIALSTGSCRSRVENVVLV